MTDDLPQRFTEAERIRQIEQKVNGLAVGGGASASIVVEDDDGTIRFESGLLTDGSYGIRVYDPTGTPVSTGGGESTDIPTASQIEFTPTGTISSSDVQAAIAEVAAEAGSGSSSSSVLSVKDFGAIGDGTSHPLSERFVTLGAAQAVYPHATALTDQIDWAALYAAGAAGEPVWVPKGTYLVNRSVLQAPGSVFFGNHPLGYDPPGTTIKATNGSNLDAVVCTANWYNNVATPPAAHGIVGIQIDANIANQTGGWQYGFVTSALKGFALRSSVINTGNTAFLCAGFMRNNSTEYTQGVPETRFEQCYATNVVVGFGNNSQWMTDGFVVDCVAWNTALEGISLATATGWIVKGNHTYGTGQAGIYAANLHFSRIIGNYLETFGQRPGQTNAYGMKLSATVFEGSAVITGNQIYGETTSLEGNPKLAGDTAIGTTVPHGIWLDINSTSPQSIVISDNTVRFNWNASGGATRAGSTGLRVTSTGGGVHTVSESNNLLLNWVTIRNLDAAVDRVGTYRAGAGILATDDWFAALAGNAAQIILGPFGPGNTAGILLGLSGSDVLWTTGNGTPEGVVTARVGSLYTRRDGGASTTLYVKQSGTGNTGWVAK